MNNDRIYYKELTSLAIFSVLNDFFPLASKTHQKIALLMIGVAIK